MILNHFTTLTALGITKAGTLNICAHWPEGVTPHQGNGLGQCLDLGEPVVWLTADPEPGSDRPGFCIRLRVEITSTDRLLVPFWKWRSPIFVAGRPIPASEFHDTLRATEPELWRRSLPWYVYRGTIGLTQLRGIDGMRQWPWFMTK